MAYTERQVKSARKFLTKFAHLLKWDRMVTMCNSRRNYLTKRYTWANKILRWADKHMPRPERKVMAICESCEKLIYRGMRCHRLNPIVYVCGACGGNEGLGRGIKANFTPIQYNKKGGVIWD